jgi:hypothetical protein
MRFAEVGYQFVAKRVGGGHQQPEIVGLARSDAAIAAQEHAKVSARSAGLRIGEFSTTRLCNTRGNAASRLRGDKLSKMGGKICQSVQLGLAQERSRLTLRRSGRRRPSGNRPRRWGRWPL